MLVMINYKFPSQVDDKLCVCSAEVSSLNGKVSDLLVSLVSLLLIQSHCSSDPECSSRVQISSQPDPQTPSGALIHVPHYLGNLPFRVWKKMQDIVQNRESVLLQIHCKWHIGEYLICVLVSRRSPEVLQCAELRNLKWCFMCLFTLYSHYNFDYILKY